MRVLKHHEAKLLRKVDFLTWRGEGNLRVSALVRRYGLDSPEELVAYRKLCGLITSLVASLRALPAASVFRANVSASRRRFPVAGSFGKGSTGATRASTQAAIHAPTRAPVAVPPALPAVAPPPAAAPGVAAVPAPGAPAAVTQVLSAPPVAPAPTLAEPSAPPPQAVPAPAAPVAEAHSATPAVAERPHRARRAPATPRARTPPRASPRRG
jgi:hypothetical protein